MEKLNNSLNFPNALVVTGAISSGKSSMCKILQTLGYDILDADVIAHGVLQGMRNEIEDEFGSQFVKGNQVNRMKLGELVFSDVQAMQRLEQLTHPEINRQIIAEAKTLEQKNKLYFMDIPLFFEVQPNYTVAAVILVYCKKEISLGRLMRRNSLSLSEAEQRICMQLDIEKKRKLANFIVDNSSDKENLRIQTKRLVHQLSERFNV